MGFCVRDDEERRLERVRSSLDRHLALLHGLEERRLRLRRRAVDLVREQQVREDRPGPELEVGVALIPDRRARDVGRHEVGGELDAREPQGQDLRERARGQRLREPRVVLEQHVTVGEEPEPDELERLALADDGLLDLVEHRARDLADLRELHQMRSNESTVAISSAGGMPRPSRSSGGGRSARTSSQVASPRTAHAPRRLVVERDSSARLEQSGGDVVQPGPEPKVEVERTGDAERSLVLDAGEALRRAAPRRGALRTRDQRGAPADSRA